MFNNTVSPAAHLLRHPPTAQQHNDPQFPRGECRYIHSTPNLDGSSRRRCPCQSFWLEDDIPGSTCKCGHQAWAHTLDRPIASVPMEEHNALVERVNFLELELEKERQQRQEEVKNLYKAIHGAYSHLALISHQMGARMLGMDDKIEAVLDQTHACHGGLKSLQEKVISVDDATMDLETRIDRLESSPHTPKSASPVSEAIEILERSSMLPPPIDKIENHAWTVKVMLMPQSSGVPFAVGSVGYRRCVSRNLLRELYLADSSSSAFVSAVDNAFLKLLRNRSWMPLITYESTPRASEWRHSLRGLPADKCSPDLWDRNFLQEYCVHYEKELGDVIYISLESGDLTWQEIRKLPRAQGVDQTCWDHASELDNPRTIVIHERVDFGLNADDGYDLPPYSSRAPSNAGQIPIPTPQLSNPLQRSQSINLRDFDASGGEHVLKKVCLRPKSEIPSIPKEATPQIQNQYISGRTKRKVTVKEKQSQPGNRLSDWKNPVQTLLHSHAGREKDVGNSS